MPQLFPHLPFQPDETPASWAARLSVLHGCSTLRTFLSDQSIASPDFLHGRRSVIDRLCEVAGQDAAPVWHNTAVSVGNQNFTLRSEPFPASMMVREETRFCPLCLHQDDLLGGDPGICRRDRLAWSLRVVTTCPEHGIALIYRGRDHRDKMQRKLIEHVPERGATLVALAENGMRREPSPLQTYVLGRLEGRSGPQWLDGQTLEQAVRTTQMLGVVMAFGTTINLGSVDRDGWDLAGRMGWRWVAAGEHGLHAAFAELQAAAFERGQGGQNYFTVLGQLYRWLLEPGNRPDHGPIKQLLRNYIVQNMDVCVGRDLLGERIERRRKYSVQSLALQSGLHPQTLGKVLVERRLIGAENADKPASILLVDAEEGRQAAASLSRSVPFVQLPALLGATRPIASCLIDLGVLTPLTRSQGENTRDKCGFDALEVEQALEQIHVMVPEMSDVPAEWVSLNQCSKRARIPMRDLLQMILSGKLRQIGRAQGELGFNSLRISIENIRLVAS
ncbi:TniQ family protein [Paracoccus sp. AK26]|uniref:TniQ family protein n=1 Tax=Paracoccus sp. AK26 TaxID=2589076 RepID=UPI0014286672|nr:TniQ family protein [Paracoccus sp. AK26]QIR84943.1 TniQ family protein [Paracoccus sp. AK26]